MRINIATAIHKANGNPFFNEEDEGEGVSSTMIEANKPSHKIIDSLKGNSRVNRSRSHRLLLFSFNRKDRAGCNGLTLHKSEVRYHLHGVSPTETDPLSVISRHAGRLMP